MFEMDYKIGSNGRVFVNTKTNYKSRFIIPFIQSFLKPMYGRPIDDKFEKDLISIEEKIILFVDVLEFLGEEVHMQPQIKTEVVIR